jgi:hypothetical protein
VFDETSSEEIWDEMLVDSFEVFNRGNLDGNAVSQELGDNSPLSLQAGTNYAYELSIGGCMCLSFVKSANQARLLMEKNSGGTMAVEERLFALKVKWSLTVLFSLKVKLAWLDPNNFESSGIWAYVRPQLGTSCVSKGSVMSQPKCGPEEA